MRFIPKEDCFKYEKALTFLVEEYNKTGYNEKPVIFHSISVANYLLNNDYDISLVAAALLHDLIEDSNIKESDIEEEFSEKVSSLVKSLSFNPDIENKRKRYVEMFKRVKEKGKEALIVKCADIYSNSFYIKMVKKEKERLFLIEKIKYFLDMSEDLIGEEIVWKDLNNKLQCLLKNNLVLTD